jgi:hypothetical protein
MPVLAWRIVPAMLCTRLGSANMFNRRKIPHRTIPTHAAQPGKHPAPVPATSQSS